MVELLRKAGYSEKAIDYYMRKANVGVIEGAEAVDSYTGFCGDSMRVYLKIEEGLIKDATFLSPLPEGYCLLTTNAK